MAAQLSAAATVLNSWHQISSSATFFKTKAYPNYQRFYPYPRTARVTAATGGSEKNSTKEEDDDSGGTPSWAKPGSDELPPWARQEAQKEASDFQVPFFVYLLASAITAIASIGSIFEYVNQKPVFGVLYSDSALYAPLLGFFVFTGIPSSAFLWFKSVQVANKEAEEQDQRDGYR